MLQLLHKVKVDKKIKPIEYTLRQQPELIVGNGYFVSFIKNEAYPCTLVEIVDDRYLTIEIPAKSKKKLIGMDGKVIENPKERITTLKINIGATPEQAVRQQDMSGLGSE